MKKWIVQLFFQGKLDHTEIFTSKEEALAYYQNKAGACRFGLVGWSVSYPREQ
jgi:hypothetical protein